MKTLHVIAEVAKGRHGYQTMDDHSLLVTNAHHPPRKGDLFLKPSGRPGGVSEQVSRILQQELQNDSGNDPTGDTAQPDAGR